MRCDTCKEESPVIMRVVIDRDYNRVLARAMYNCPACFGKKEQSKRQTVSTKQARPAKSDDRGG